MAELELMLKVQGQTLSIQEFQDMIGKHFFDKLYKQLQRDSHQPFPIHDPTEGELIGYPLQVVLGHPQNKHFRGTALEHVKYAFYCFSDLLKQLDSLQNTSYVRSLNSTITPPYRFPAVVHALLA